MEQRFISYLESIGITGTLVNRIESILSFYQDICSSKIEDIFVSEYLTEDGLRQYENLWLFSKKSAMEAKQFVTGDNYDDSVFNKKIIRWELSKIDYDFNKATEKSRAFLNIMIGGAVSGVFKASKENCDQLLMVFKKHILPNMKE
jgi:hypothetical protein